MWLCAAAVLAAGCTRQPAPVPRRTAYPRVAEIGTAMRLADSLPVHFEVNAEATLSRPRKDWLDVTYPMYGATVHITFTEVRGETLDKTKANRMERVMLNTGGLPSERREWINAAGFDILTVHTDGCATPYQFIATDGQRHVVSGAVYFASPAATQATDSIAPMLRAIETDMERGLNSLR